MESRPTKRRTLASLAFERWGLDRSCTKTATLGSRDRQQHGTRLATVQLAALVVASVSLMSGAGCQVASKTQSKIDATDAVSFMGADEFAVVLAEKSDTLLVEFCVPSGCVRCDQMRGPVDKLAIDQGERLTVRRVNLRRYPELAWEFGVEVCPSYIAFRDGKEFFRAAYPTSAGLIAARLEESLGDRHREVASLEGVDQPVVGSLLEDRLLTGSEGFELVETVQ